MSAYQATLVGSKAASPAVLIRQPTNSQIPIASLGLVVTLSPGTSLTYSVQVTADQFPSPGGNWNDHEVLVGQAASANSNILYPVTGVRLNVTAWTSGTANLGIAQWP